VCAEQGKIALLIAMEGVEPLGTDLNMLRIFYELGLRLIGLTHVRTNAAAHGGVFAASGSSPQGLTGFDVHFIPDLLHHGHARNLTAKLIERGFNDNQIEKILFRNWLRILEELL
jgi:membrane dipeptidase